MVLKSVARPRKKEPELFINRELSWLEFNRRVLEEAQDETVPLLERVKFLAIFSSNLDEFYMVRVAGLKRQIAAGDRSIGPDGLTASETMLAVAARIHELVEETLVYGGYLSLTVSTRGVRDGLLLRETFGAAR